MPSAMKRLFLFGKKNKGPKFSEFQGYDDLRHSAYPITPHATHQAQPPPHSFATQRQQQQQHHQNQLYPQQLIASPQAHIISQCQCQQCIYQQQQQMLGQQPTQAQLLASPNAGQPHPVVQQAQVLHQSQSQPQLQPQQPAQTTTTTTIQQYQPHQQHSQLQPQFAQHFISQTAHIPAPTTTVAQCTCQHCPYQQQLQQQMQQQQHQQQLQQHHHHQQQQQQQQTLPGQQMQLNHMIQMNGTNTCQHQANQMQLNHQIPPQHQQQQQLYLNHGHAIQQQAPQITPIILQPTIQPTLQQHQHQSQQQMQQPPQTQLQLQPQQFQCHTIQSPAKQHHHQRVQSLHQQSLPAYQPQHMIQQQQHQQKTQHQTRHQEQCVESQSESYNFSRYANMQSLLDDKSKFIYQKSEREFKFEEHVYCNQKLPPESTMSPGPVLPPYKAPPDYDTYLQQRKIELNGQHLTCELALHVGYANLGNRFSPYGNLGVGRQEPGFTS